MEITRFVWLHGAAAYTPLEPPCPPSFQNFWIKSISGYHKVCRATTFVALNTIVVYSWTVTIEQPDRLVVQVYTSELYLHQFEETKEFT